MSEDFRLAPGRGEADDPAFTEHRGGRLGTPEAALRVQSLREGGGTPLFLA
jgi:hypothetical protein